MHNLKTKNCVLFGRQTEDLSLGDSLSDGSDRLLQRDKGGARIYEFFKTKAKTQNSGSWNSKRLWLIKEKSDISNK